MTDKNKMLKLKRQKSLEQRSQLPPFHQKKNHMNDGFERHGVKHSPDPSRSRIDERSEITRRSKKVPITLAPLPWEKKRMRKEEAVALIDGHKNKLINPVDMLHWTWLRVIVNNMTEEEWDAAVAKAVEVLAR